MAEPWKTRVQDLSDRNEETQSTIETGMWVARSLALSVEALTFSKPALMSRRRVEAFSLGLWRVVTSCIGARQTWEELRPGREPHWFRSSRPLDRAMADRRTVITRFRIFDMLLRRTMMRKKEGES